MHGLSKHFSLLSRVLNDYPATFINVLAEVCLTTSTSIASCIAVGGRARG